MAGSVRFEPSSASPEDLDFGGGYVTGLRGNHSGASLDRSGSFRDSGESQMFNSGSSTPRGNATVTGNLPPLSHSLMLDPISMVEQNFTWLDESRKLLGISTGSSAQDNAFGAVNAKHSPTVVTDALNRFKASVLDAANKARVRAKKLDDSANKLNWYCESLNSKKQQRNEFIKNQRSGGSNLSKMGTLTHQNAPDLRTQRHDGRTKSVVMNRRVRSSATDIKGEGRGTMLIRQPMVVEKNRDMLRGEGSDFIEDKIRTLPAGGEAWDKKKRRKRSVGTIFSRPTDADAELKQTLHQKPNDESDTQACDAQSFRSGPFNSGNSTKKLDCNSMSGNANTRVMLKSELDNVFLSMDSMTGLGKERLVPKGNNEDNQLSGPNPVEKGNTSRARSGPKAECNSSPCFARSLGAVEGWEQSPNGNKKHLPSGTTNRKRPIPTGAASPPMAQWVGQRPQKISRTRRANLVSPVSNLDELQTPSDGCFPSDVGFRFNSSGTNGLLHKTVAIDAQQIRIKQEIVSSPARLYESKESVTGANHESRVKEKVPSGGEVDERAKNSVQTTSSTMSPAKKNKMVNKEETGSGVRKQGRSGRVSSVSKASNMAPREKLETPTSGKPHKSMRLGSEKNGSKSGRPPLKKLSDRKAFASLGHLSSNGSPDCTGESDDDREELLEAANFACNARNLACSSPFWKKMEPIFGFSVEEGLYLKEQGDVVHRENFVSNALFCGSKQRIVQDQIQEVGIFRGSVDSVGRKEVPPLYQRVLSALILEDETDEFGEDLNDIGIQFANESNLGPHSVIQCSVDSFFCNGISGVPNVTGICDQLSNDDLLKGDTLHSNTGIFPVFSTNGVEGSLYPCTNSSSSFVHPYEKMSLEDRLLLELESVGLYQEIVPDLEDGEDRAIDQDIAGLQKQLQQQVDRKKIQLKKFTKAIEEGMERERRHREQVAMDKLVELAYRKLLATRGSMASKLGISRVPRQNAIAFMKRTLARCRKFDETGQSCFNEPALQDVIFAAPLYCSNGEPVICSGLPPENQKCEQGRISGSSGVQHDHHNKFGRSGSFESLPNTFEQEFPKTRPMLYRGKKKEVLLDDVGGSPLKASNPGSTLSGRAKGKRSERERDKDTTTRNSVAKPSRPPLGNSKGERKTKTKPKQKTARLSNSGNGLISNVPSATEGPRERKEDMGITKLPLHELDSIELGVANNDDLGGNQDFWLDIDVDGLQDHDAEGLDIPMDDLSDLAMLL